MACKVSALKFFFPLLASHSAMGKKPNPHAQALGRLGGEARAKKLSAVEIAKIASKGGKARAAKLSPAERSRIAKLAVTARERKKKGGK